MLGFAYDRDDEYSRDFYHNGDYKGADVSVYADRNTVRMELRRGHSKYRKCYGTLTDLRDTEEIGTLLGSFLGDMTRTYHIAL